MDQIVGNVKGAWLAYYNELNPLPFAQLVNGCCVVLALLLFQTWAVLAFVAGAAGATLGVRTRTPLAAVASSASEF